MPPEVRKLPPPIQDHLVQLLADGFHVGIGKASVQRAHAVGVVARAADDLLSWLLVVGWLRLKSQSTDHRNKNKIEIILQK